jgi:hypothetical protein
MCNMYAGASEPLSDLEKCVLSVARQHDMVLQTVWWHPEAFYV